MLVPEVHYVRTPDGRDISYQVVGDGPVDLTFVRPFPSNLDVMWELPAMERFLRRLASFSRLILPESGGGLADHRPGSSTEDFVRDSLCILDHIGVERTVLLGADPPATFTGWFAAAYPDRTSSIVMIDPAAKWRRAPDYPWGMPPEMQQRILDIVVSTWGTGKILHAMMQGRPIDDATVRWYGRLERSTYTPASAEKNMRGAWLDADLTGVLGLITCPALIITHPEHGWIRPEHGRYIAERITGAKLVERPGPYAMWWIDDVDATLDLIETFVTGQGATTVPTDRVLATVLFTDIVGSTERAAEMGDARWRELLDIQDSVLRRQVERFGGRLVGVAGDGALATFDGPARAIRCGIAIRDQMRTIDLEVRTGVHAGEVELRGDDIGGLAVHVGARVMSEAGPGEVMVSSIVKDLVAGSGIAFEDRGARALKGVPEEWRLYAVTDG